MHSSCYELFYASINKMPQLTSLTFKMDLFSSTDPPILQLPPSLLSLRLEMRLQSILLTLRDTGLSEDPIVALRSLPNLSYLRMYGAYRGRRIGVCSRGSFPSLKILLIQWFYDWEEWGEIEEGSIPCLSYLKVSNCPKLKMLPQGFQHLHALRHLHCKWMPPDFKKRLQPCKGEDYYKISHIPLVSR
ncbi:hypothetical protein AMTRI_Chr10g8110 [Amborella trichopoda]